VPARHAQRPRISCRKILGAASGKVPSYNQVLVDEFQDFNQLEVSLIDLLAGKSPILLAGDDDQARMISRARAQHISATDMATKVRTMRPLGVWRGRCFTELLDFAGRRAQPPAADRSRHRLAELRHRLAELT
jgi:hypothetical protein